MRSHLVSIAISIVLCAAPALAATDYDFHLLEVDISGPDPFHDDFADGDRFAPPTVRVYDAAGSSTEEPGFLRFQGGDGGDPLSYTNGATGFQDLSAFLNSSLTDLLAFPDGGGPGVFTSTWDGDLPVLGPTEFLRGFTSLVQVVSPSTAGSTLLFTMEVGAISVPAPSTPPTCSTSDPQVLIERLTDTGGAVLACDPLDPEAVAPDSVTFRITFDDVGNTLAFAYSLDGGSSFKDSSQWAEPLSALFVPEMTAGAMAPIVGAYGAGFNAVPGPGPLVAVVLLLSGATALCAAAPDKVLPRRAVLDACHANGGAAR